MRRKPRKTNEKVLDKKSLRFVLLIGFVIAVISLYKFYIELPDLARAQTMAFTTLVILEMAVAASFRSPKYLFKGKLDQNKKLWLAIVSSILLQVAVVQLPIFNPIFDTVPLTLDDWIAILALGWILLVAIQIVKLIAIKLESRPKKPENPGQKEK